MATRGGRRVTGAGPTAVVVAVGEVYQDRDPRMKGRRVVIEGIEDGHARVRTVGTDRRTRIALERFRATGRGYERVTPPSR